MMHQSPRIASAALAGLLATVTGGALAQSTDIGECGPAPSAAASDSHSALYLIDGESRTEADLPPAQQQALFDARLQHFKKQLEIFRELFPEGFQGDRWQTAHRGTDAAKRLKRAEVPAPRAVFGPLRLAYQGSVATTDYVRRVALFQPMFRSACETCGPGLQLENGFPYLHGDLRLRLGANVALNGQSAFAASKVLDAPTLTIGDGSRLSFGVVISVGPIYISSE